MQQKNGQVSNIMGQPALAAIFGGIALLGAALASPACAQIVEGNDLSKLSPEAKEKVLINAGVVSMLVSGSTCTCARFAEDIRNVLNDGANPRAGGVRLIPVLGDGGLQNVKDTLFLSGINMAIVDESTLKVLKQKNPRAYGDIDRKLRYVTKLYNAEFQILAKNEVKGIADLAGKTVNFDYKDSDTDLIASKMFSDTGIAVKVTHDDQRFALQRLLSGDIAAIAVSTGAPQDSLAQLGPDTGLHFLPIDEASLAGHKPKTALKDYLPAELTHDMYPNLIAEGQTVPTIASRVVLVISNWEQDHLRYQRNAQFVQAFFSRIDALRNPARHPKWRDVNLAAEMPGWTRFKPAQEWLDQDKARTAAASQTGNTASNPDQKAQFDTFVEQHAKASGEAANADEREKLFAEFQKFWDAQNKQEKEH